MIETSLLKENKWLKKKEEKVEKKGIQTIIIIITIMYFLNTLYFQDSKLSPLRLEPRNLSLCPLLVLMINVLPLEHGMMGSYYVLKS